MRYAIISDIHANLHAWNAVKEDIESQGIEALVCLGDIIGYGPRPAETLDSVCAMANYIVLGNHEAVIEGSFDRSQFNDEAWKMIEWTGKQLNQDTGKFFEQLPLVVELDAGICRTLFVHGSSCQPEAFNYILDEESALKAWEGCESTLVFAGHTHETALFILDGELVSTPKPADFSIEPGRKYIVNVGSVGMPRESDCRASYCIFDTDSGSVYFRRVSYDFEAYRKDVLDIIGESEQSRHVLCYFKESQAIPVREQLDFIPATESQLLARPVVHAERVSIKANGKPPPKQFRLKRSPAAVPAPSEKSPAREGHGLNIKLWIMVCGFFLAVAAAAMLIAFLAPSRHKPEKAEPEKKEEILLNVVQAKTTAPADIANREAMPVQDEKGAREAGAKTNVPSIRRDVAPVAPSTLGISLETNFGDGAGYRNISVQELNVSLPEGWNETSSWGNPPCSYSFQAEGQSGYLKCEGKEKGRPQIYHAFAELASSKTFNVSVKAKGPPKTEFLVAFVALEKPWTLYDSAVLKLSSDWKSFSTMLTCGPTPAGIPVGFMIYTRNPGSMDIMSIKVEEISFSRRPK